jgi:hypothetical protein
MHIKFVLKHLSRGWIRSVLWVVLLAAVISFFTVSAGQWHVSRQNLAAMDEIFTTTAVVDDLGFWRSNKHLLRLVDSNGHLIRVTGVDKAGDDPDPEIAILEQAASLKMIKVIDNRQSSRAFSQDIFPVVHPLESLEAAIARDEADRSESFQQWREVIAKYGHPFEYWELQEGLSSAILTGKCVSIDIATSSVLGPLNYTVVFEIDQYQSPVVHPFYQGFKYLEIAALGILPSYELPFTVGKDYLLATANLSPKVFLPQYSSGGGLADLCAEPEWFLRGELQGSSNMLLDVPGNKRERYFTDEMLNSPDFWKMLYSPFTEDVATALGIPYAEYPFQMFYPLADELILSRQELTGSAADFLDSERGGPWRQAVEIANKNTHALTVIGTENLQSIAHFNRRDAHILEGREFSRDEYNEGAGVCIISASLARENGLELGDELSLSMQRTGYCPQYLPNSNDIFWYQPMEFTSSCLEFTEAKSYSIVGIYSAPEWDYHFNSFSPNTIFIPQKAFPEGIPSTSNPPCEERAGMLSLILQNGSQATFLDAIAGTELAGKVQVLDQGYGRIASQIRTLWEEARALFIVSSLLWLIVMAFFFLLVTRRLRPGLGIMVSLGVKKGHIRQFMLSYIVILSLCGLIIGGVVGTAVYRGVLARTYASLQDAISATDLSLILADIIPGLPMAYILVQGLILILVAGAIALTVRLNVRPLLNRGLKI